MSAEPLGPDPNETASDADCSNENLLLRSLGIAELGDVTVDSNTVDREQALAAILEHPGLTQHVTRSRHEDCDTLLGHYRCDFSASQQRAVIHVPICPPMESVPSVETLVVEPSSDTINWISEARIRVTDAQKFGLRIEVVLAQPSQGEAHVMIEIVVTASAEPPSQA